MLELGSHHTPGPTPTPIASLQPCHYLAQGLVIHSGIFSRKDETFGQLNLPPEAVQA